MIIIILIHYAQSVRLIIDIKHLLTAKEAEKACYVIVTPLPIKRTGCKATCSRILDLGSGRFECVAT